MNDYLAIITIWPGVQSASAEIDVLRVDHHGKALNEPKY